MTNLPLLDAIKAPRALRMWDRGLDTMQIAIVLDAPEAAVFNSLRRLREERRARKDAA
jgi:hypothetical protein